MKEVLLAGLLLVSGLVFAQHEEYQPIISVDLALGAVVYEEDNTLFYIDLNDGCHYVLETQKDKIEIDGTQVCQSNLVVL